MLHTHEVTGSSPVVSTKYKTPSDRMGFLYLVWCLDEGLEPIAVQGSGGALLPPVQKLVATLIFDRLRSKMHIESVVFLKDVSLKYAAIRGIICLISKNLTGGVSVERYPITEKDKELIKIGLQVLANNFDDGIYNHTVGCAVLCKNGKVYNCCCSRETS